ncbi:putative phage abortive infection protein [uncultured Polaribacter sp.]|uniref:putative phage abortive infection protein n=1 Tax=uncultured Polaribacter sp. TaxID=174711 RepID=UPI00261E59A2|nr:putative phage abortive infection protein [uncultured Polaribacter sp.]
MMEESEKKQEENTYKHFWLIVSISILLVLGLWIWNWLALNEYPEDTRGTHGDMFGAVNAIFSGLAFAGIIISLYLQRIDLKNQFKEIKQTNREFKIQNDTLHIQKFENQYYKMIDLHRANVNEISIPFFDLLGDSPTSKINVKIEVKSPNLILREVTGKKGFVDMAKELEYCLEISLDFFTKRNDFKYNEKDIFSFAYSIFFWGVYSDFAGSEKIIDEHQELVKNHLKQEQSNYKRNLYQGNSQEINTRYVPFQGHESRLAHYYRHLFQTVKYVTIQVESKNIDYSEARQYLRVLRAQLSNSEQLMLYYNYICGFGQNWDRLGKENYQFFTKYRMIHNIPVDRVVFVEKPRVHFRKYIIEEIKGKDSLFEWGDYES